MINSKDSANALNRIIDLLTDIAERLSAIESRLDKITTEGPILDLADTEEPAPTPTPEPAPR